MSKSADKQHRLKGHCLCGGTKYEVQAPLRPVVKYHCGQCRRTHGHYSAYTTAARDDLVLHDDRTLSWYESSAIARRSFCARCGASPFWDAHDRPTIGIAAGTLDQPTGFVTAGQIFVNIEDTLSKLPRGHAS